VNAKETKGKCPTTRKAPILACLLLREKLSECGRCKRRSPTMKKPRQHSMKIGSALRKERLVREVTEGPMLAPTPELPDDTPIERVLFSTRIQNALRAADLKTVGEVREISDETLIRLPDFGKGSLSDLRKKLGLPSADGVRPLGKKPT
jgi:DNA-directed RNA polymerase alpha subunit